MFKSENILRKASLRALKDVLVLALSLFAFLPGAFAQERVSKVGSGEYSYDFRIFFPVNVPEFTPGYLENPQTLAKLDSVIAVHGTGLIDSLLVIAQSSPEGNYAHNVDLANGRAASMKE